MIADIGDQGIYGVGLCCIFYMLNMLLCHANWNCSCEGNQEEGLSGD